MGSGHGKGVPLLGVPGEISKVLKKPQGCRFVPYTFSQTKPQMVPTDLNIGFAGLALIQGQIYNPEPFCKGIATEVMKRSV